MSRFDKLWFAKACIFLLAVAQYAHDGVAQVSDEKPLPAFDVVSLHLAPDKTITYPGGSSTFKPTKSCQYLVDRVRCQVSLTSLIMEAYRVKRPEIVRPHWLDDDVIVLEGTMPLNTNQDTARLMLQATLAERLGLKLHRENRELTVYAMVAAKGGLRLQVADIQSQRKVKVVDTPSGSISAPIGAQPGRFFATAISLDDVASMIQRCYGQVPVVNLTGASEGEYKFDMQWPGEEQMSECVLDQGFADALEKQYGIRIEKRKTPMNVLVVDQIKRAPTDN
jgi:uncharacterized protein (TIGR03435 family)